MISNTAMVGGRGRAGPGRGVVLAKVKIAKVVISTSVSGKNGAVFQTVFFLAYVKNKSIATAV
jgi:hypothetical protein